MSESEGAELSRRRRCGSSPAALTSLPDDDDLLREILLRLPPQPSSLPRASAVCRRWRHLATDPKFIARFHAHHRKPPLLGVFEHLDQNIMFTPVLDPPDSIPPGRFDLRIRDSHSFVGAQLLGCHHDRVLIMTGCGHGSLCAAPSPANSAACPFHQGSRDSFSAGPWYAPPATRDTCTAAATPNPSKWSCYPWKALTAEPEPVFTPPRPAYGAISSQQCGLLWV